MDPMRVSITYPSMMQYDQGLQPSLPWSGICVRKTRSRRKERSWQIDFITSNDRGTYISAFMTMSADNARALAAAINLALKSDNEFAELELR